MLACTVALTLTHDYHDMKLKLQSYSITCLSSIYFHELEQPRSKNQDSVGFRSPFMDFNSLFTPALKMRVPSRPYTPVVLLPSLKMASGS